MKLLVQRLRRWRYAWAIAPVLLLGLLALNNHLYYNIFYGYDMPQHFLNVHVIRTTGSPPTPDNNPPDNYEAHQAPLFYILATWVLILSDPFVGDGMLYFMPVALLLLDVLWIGMMTHLIEHFLRRVHPLFKALTLLVVMLLPMHVMARAMFGNDLPVLMFGTLAAFALWRLARGRTLERGAWLRAAALCGFAVAFKNNGIVLFGSYLALAGFVVVHNLTRRHWRRTLRVFGYAALGLPLMLVPFLVNNYQTMQFLDDPIGAMGIIPTIPDTPPDHVGFLLRFDPTLFLSPFAYKYGYRGYWSLEYVTLHSDYYNHWSSDAYNTWDANLLTAMPHRFAMPIARYNDLLLLQFLAVPVTFVMVFAVVHAAYRCLLHWRGAIRDGSALVLLFTVAAHAAQIVRYLSYPYVDAVVIHARYIGFLWFFLFIVGIYWLAKLLRSNRGWYGAVVGAGAALMAAYSFIALRAMWLPPV
ncbi:MAG: hypothetical protein U0694_02710 [Anaerolineae bacterium]